MRYPKYIKVITLLSLPVILLAASLFPTDETIAEVQTDDNPSFEAVAVLELFTSEGCSSCPPADRLLSTIINEAEQSGQKIFALSFHVDYWNRLGWKDPFSKEAFSERQRAYARKLAQQVYTPQMIVNGSAVFVGSRSQTAKTEIDKALQEEAAHRIQLVAQQTDNAQAIKIQYAVEGSLKGKQLQLAVVERGLEVTVGRGENRGRKLQHDHVVRSFTTIPLDNQSKGEIQLSLPSDMACGNASLIAYVQDAKTLRISGAKQVKLPLEGIVQK